MLTVPSHALDIALMSNGAPVDPIALATEIVDIVLGDKVLGAPRPVAQRTSENPGLLGKYLSVSPLQVLEIVERDERLHAVTYNQPHHLQPLIANERGYRIDDGAGAQTRVVPHVRASTGEVPAIDFIESGHVVTLNRYEDVPSGGALGMEGICGRYFSHDADSHAVISIEDGLLTLAIRGATGSARYHLNALTRDVWAFAPADASALTTGTMLVERLGDTATRFSLYTSRTRALGFSRVE